ncbi:hypothetical protein ACHQM5_008194 [Ranunculus cassubicifolius]
MQSVAYLVFPSSGPSIIPDSSSEMEYGVITSVTHGVMPESYVECQERGRAASAKMSDFLRRSFQSQSVT